MEVDFTLMLNIDGCNYQSVFVLNKHLANSFALTRVELVEALKPGPQALVDVMRPFDDYETPGLPEEILLQLHPIRLV